MKADKPGNLSISLHHSQIQRYKTATPLPCLATFECYRGRNKAHFKITTWKKKWELIDIQNKLPFKENKLLCWVKKLELLCIFIHRI